MSSEAPSRLVVPEGLVIDESARERLQRGLAAAPATVAGVGAATGDLAPGASYRVHAEWAALDIPAPDFTAANGSAALRGAVLVRPNVEFAVRDGAVELADGTLVADPGAHAHDPHRPVGPLQAASARGRPPFPRRPVVVFLGCEVAADDWLRRLVNRLVRRDVEARIAALDVAPGLHLTRPCLPGEATVRALAPDVVVTLDPAAAARVDAWCDGDRSTVVVAFDRALRDPMELVSWQIGRAAGRLRARIGPRVDAPAFASLIVRLCAGPHPMPPSDRPVAVGARAPVRERWTARGADDARADCLVVTGVLDEAADARVSGLVDNLEAAGVPVDVGSCGATSAVPDAARRAAVVLLTGVARTPEVDTLIAERSGLGKPTVVDVGPGDVEEHDDAGARLTASAAALVDACGLVVAPGGARFAAADRRRRRSLLLPTLLTRAHAAALRDARVPADPEALLRVGWRVGAERGPAYSTAVAEGMATILERHRAQLEVVGDAGQLPAGLRRHPRVAFVPVHELGPDVVAAWTVHVWTPALLGDAVLDDARVLEEASCAGVPSIMPERATTGVDGFVSPHVLVEPVDRAERWVDALHHVLDDPGVRARRAEEARRRADAVDGLAASKAVVSRFMGWARYEPGADRSRRSAPARTLGQLDRVVEGRSDGAASMRPGP